MASVTVVLELNMLDHVIRLMRTALGWLVEDWTTVIHHDLGVQLPAVA